MVWAHTIWRSSSTARHNASTLSLSAASSLEAGVDDAPAVVGFGESPHREGFLGLGRRHGWVLLSPEARAQGEGAKSRISIVGLETSIEALETQRAGTATAFPHSLVPRP